ncbi:MAG TPA: cation:proton antiporter [Rhizomicrobium sp.]|jgi:NhaP-type Na+/H+ or K+/H+ antiporter|nr:cation:proton antiporter [Rhizomicrobium sp.]
MTDQTRSTAVLPYVWLVLGVAAVYAVSQFGGQELLHRLAEIEDAPTAPVLASMGLVALCGFISYYATNGTPIPSFVVAIALGMAGRPLFAPIIANQLLLASLVTGGAAIILFGGGLEMPLRNFLRLLVKILLLAFPGVILTAFTLSFVIGSVTNVAGLAVPGAVVILLGAILASTDPAAIIPVLQHVKFKKRDTKDIVIAESALNDVVGTLVTSAFMKLPLAALTLAGAYQALVSAETYEFLGRQTAFGAAFGLFGYGMLWVLHHIKRRNELTSGADQIYFLATPVIAFVGAAFFGGSGFLAAFIAGLIFHAEEHMHAIEHFFYQVTDGVAKPIIFLLVGAMVDPAGLIAYAPVGIPIALIFMFVLRPAMVFLTLGVYTLFPNSERGLSVRELLFISFVRETGAIPAVLLVTAVASLAPPVTGLIEIGMWVILLTLIIAPPLTPFVARRLGVAE